MCKFDHFISVNMELLCTHDNFTDPCQNGGECMYDQSSGMVSCMWVDFN